MKKLTKLKALDLYKNFPAKISNSKFSDIYIKGYMVFENQISKNICQNILEVTKTIYKTNVKKFGINKLKEIAELGVVRSPFIYDKSYRDLLLEPLMHSICNEYFPCGYILHLCRSIILDNSSSKEVSPVEVHRDIPYLYTPTEYPLSLSFLYFFNSSSKPQLLIFKNTNKDSYYKINTSRIKINPKEGTLLAFDSNLLHCSLPVEENVAYCLFMFTTPIIKQIVTYSSEKILKKINKLNYRLNEINPLLGEKFIPPKDDDQLIERKIERINQDSTYYSTKPLEN